MEISRLCSLAWTVKHGFIIRGKGNGDLICKCDEIYVFIREMFSEYSDWFWGLPTFSSSVYQSSFPPVIAVGVWSCLLNRSVPQLDTGNRNVMDVTATPQLRTSNINICNGAVMIHEPGSFDDVSGMCGPVPPLPFASLVSCDWHNIFKIY
jgi:hypothetical protein